MCDPRAGNRRGFAFNWVTVSDLLNFIGLPWKYLIVSFAFTRGHVLISTVIPRNDSFSCWKQDIIVGEGGGRRCLIFAMTVNQMLRHLFPYYETAQKERESVFKRWRRKNCFLPSFGNVSRRFRAYLESQISFLLQKSAGQCRAHNSS